MSLDINKIYCLQAIDGIKQLDNNSIQCCIGSPPYWNLRDYSVEGQIGMENSPQEYINNLCNIYNELYIKLKDDGCLFVNLGDTYLFKQLCMIPSKFAIEMQNRGWILRNEIIWHKKNQLPSSSKDRFTVDFEKIFFFVKSKKYKFNQQFEPYSENTDVWYRKELREGKEYNVKKPYKSNTPYATAKAQNPSDTKKRILESMKNSKGKNKRCIWSINTKPFKGAHFATFPETLVEPLILSGSNENDTILDFFNGSGTTCLVSRRLKRNYIGIDLNPEYCEIANKRLGII